MEVVTADASHMPAVNIVGWSIRSIMTCISILTAAFVIWFDAAVVLSGSLTLRLQNGTGRSMTVELTVANEPANKT